MRSFAPVTEPYLPSDAHFVGRPSCALVYPRSGAWACFLADENGGMFLAEDATKTVALTAAMEAAIRWNAEVRLVNREDRL